MDKQTVTVHRRADRHEKMHERDFASTHSATVPSGSLAAVLEDAFDEIGNDLGPGRYTIEVDWPHS